MAFLPDQAIDDCKSISASAFRLYCLICRRRDHRVGRTLLDKTTAARLLDISRAQTFKAFSELEAKKWISIDGQRIEPIYGSFTPMDKFRSEVSQKRDSESQFRDFKSQKRDSPLKGLIQPYSPALFRSSVPPGGETDQRLVKLRDEEERIELSPLIKWPSSAIDS